MTAASAVLRLEQAVARGRAATKGRIPLGVGHQDATEDLGTFATDDAIGFDPFPVLRAMHIAGVQVVVMGQVAGIMHGSMELTGDLDLLWSGGAQAEGMARAFQALDAELADDDGTPVPCLGSSLAVPKIVFRTASSSGDCCTPDLPWGQLPIKDYIANCEVASTTDGTLIRYVSRQALVEMRLAVGRIKDLRRVDELRARHL